MKKIFLVYVLVALCALSARSQSQSPVSLPDSIFSGKQGEFHVQGIAVDQTRGFIYMSFTDKLLKLDFSGKVLGSVTGFAGHLGDLAFDPVTDKIYGSLEFKNDAIGKGISNKLGLVNSNNIEFYIAIFDASRIVRPDMHVDQDGLLRTVYLKEVVNDYQAQVKLGDRVVQHRFGCSGIDGVTLAPSIGAPAGSRKYLYVAYGIYGDTTRTDNDHQVILKYDIGNWDKISRVLSQDHPHHSGPASPLAKYFVMTGNTTYGVQNLAYDPSTGDFFAAVYRGTKARYPNYSLFVIDGHKAPATAEISSDGKKIRVKTLSLLQQGPEDPSSGIRGWNFKWGSTGLFPLGNGLFYISHNGSADGQQETTVYKYRWEGSDHKAFVRVQ